ncbi:hypothetical protein PNOK_m000048 (mitochondrion) [Pyrrhoderma noxium]|uniref:Uncharacterized protein n=1 Tax=Pyrrhoderma noxium TaxID=2282107 RepID=A0A541AXH8_9AGAM|nr:hypothetical protein PNOK_m000048 [Pyrrhoderma noxium]
MFFWWECSKDKIVIKASGANTKNLTFDNFVGLLNGKIVETSRLSFEVNWKTLDVNIVKVKLSLRGLEKQPIRIINVNETSLTTQFPLVVYSPKSYPLVMYSHKCYSLIVWSDKTNLSNGQEASTPTVGGAGLRY